MVLGRADFLTIRQLADRLGVEPTTIRSLLSRNRAAFHEPIYCRKNGHPRLVRILTRGESNLITKLLGFQAR